MDDIKELNNHGPEQFFFFSYRYHSGMYSRVVGPFARAQDT